MTVSLLLLFNLVAAGPPGVEKDIQAIRARFKDQKLVLIGSKAGGDYCLVETDLYFAEGELIFAFRKEDCRYPDNLTQFSEERFYFKGARCLRYLSRRAKTPQALAKTKQKHLEVSKSPEPGNVLLEANQLKKKMLEPE